MFFYDFFLGLILLLILQLRIFLLKIKLLTLKNVITLIIPLVIFGFKLNNLNQIPKYNDLNSEVELKINSDDLNIKNDIYFGTGYIKKINQKIMFYGFLNNPGEKKLINDLVNTSVLKVKGTLNEVSEASNYGVFDSKKYYQQKKIINELKIDQIDGISDNYRLNIFDKLHDLRCKLIKRNQKLTRSLRIYINSLIYDEMNGVKQLGLIHLFSISGFHIYYLIGLITFIFTIFKIRIERINFFVMCFLPIYFVIAGSASSLVRSILLSEIRILTHKLLIHFNSLDMWSLSLMINLLINPMIIFQLGGQLSYLLSFALIYTKNCNFIRQTILMNLIGIPIIMFHIYEWHVLSLAINLIVLPIFSIFILPIVILGYLSSFMMPYLAFLFDFLLSFFDKSLVLISKLPGNIIFGRPHLYIVILLLLITLLCIQKISKYKIGLLICIYLVTFLWIHYPIKGEVTFIDVGQGDSIFIRQPFHKSGSLIDTGGKLNFNQKKNQKEKFQAERIGIRYLKSIGINKIDNIYLSHQDTDHVVLCNYKCLCNNDL